MASGMLHSPGAMALLKIFCYNLSAPPLSLPPLPALLYLLLKTLFPLWHFHGHMFMFRLGGPCQQQAWQGHGKPKVHKCQACKNS